MSSLTNTPSLIPVVGARPGVMVEVIPGKKYLPLSEDSVPPVAVAESVPAGDGTWRWMAKICPQWVSITKRNLARLGIGISVQGMRRLCTAGFVQARQVTPGFVSIFLPRLPRTRRGNRRPGVLGTH